MSVGFCRGCVHSCAALGLALGFFVTAAVAQAQVTDSTIIGNTEPFSVSFKDIEKVPEDFHRQEITYDTPHQPGTVVVDTDSRFLYFVLPEGRAIRYGIGVGREGFEWNGVAEIGRKTPWPYWFPPKAMVARDRFAAKWAKGMPGGPKNPLGARALYLFENGADTLYRIHGTNQPSSIGQAVSSGCVRMLNVDVIDLYERVSEGTKVVVIGTPRPRTVAKAKPLARMPRKVARKVPNPTIGWFQTVQNDRLAANKKAGLQPKLIRKTNFNLNRAKLVSQ
jgi:lipoprotein-anchoring transpeptidase ErfK/SrfK